MSAGSIVYADRHSGALLTEKIYARRFLFWSSNTLLGRWFTRFVFRQPLLSRCYGWYQRRGWSRRRIRPFAAAFGVRLEECVQPLEAFECFNDFFLRSIDLHHRPMVQDPAVCAAPTDGKVLAYQRIDAHETFLIKGARFALAPFLGDLELTRRFDGGSMLISRLHLSDYHHFHFPVSCVPGRATLIEGKLQAVAPYSRRWPALFYTENRRVLTELRSEEFGTILMVEIGAFTVGSIRQCFEPGHAVAKGVRKGHFELGGSTVVLLFEPGAIRLSADLCARTAEQIETYVQLGEAVGCRASRQ